MVSNIPVVDGAIAYDCPITGQTYILINALHIPTMQNNLIPPFIMRAGGVIVNKKPKVQCIYPGVNDYCILFPDADVKIHLQLHGIFSCFDTRIPLIDELDNCNKMFISPDSRDWNPNCTSFAENEKAMATFDGEIAEPDRQKDLKMILEDETEQVYEMTSVSVYKWEDCVNSNISSSFVALEVDPQPTPPSLQLP